MKLFERWTKKKTITDERDKQTFWKGSYTPTYNYEEQLWGAETYAGVRCGDLTYVAYTICGVQMSFPYHTGDGTTDYAENFEQILSALNHSPETFSIVGFESKYSDQERRLLGALQEALLQIKKTGRPLTQEEIDMLRTKYRALSG